MYIELKKGLEVEHINGVNYVPLSVLKKYGIEVIFKDDNIILRY